MPDFLYNARDSNGAAQAGSIAAPSRASAATQLREKGWVVLKVESNEVEEVAKSPGLLTNLPPRKMHIELSLQQIAMMLRSGMTLLQSIRSVAEQSPRESLKRIWDDVSSQIQRGQGLADAMETHRCFPPFAIRLVQVGERTGNLSIVMSRASETMRQRRLARESFVSATIYPLLVLLLSVFVTAYMILYLIPRLETYLQSLGRDMPMMTQSLIDASFWMRANWQFLLAGLLITFVSICCIYLSRDGRRWLDRVLLNVPGIGKLMRLGETATFARGMSMMLKSGITVTDGLSSVEDTLGNYHLRTAVTAAREKLIRGSNLADSLNQRNTFTSLLRQMVSVGEQSGDLAGVLDEVSIVSEQQFAAMVKRLNAILTPSITLMIGGVVGYVYIAFFMALIAAGS